MATFILLIKENNDIATQQLRRREAQLQEEVKFYKQRKDKEKELRSINNRILSDLSLEYTDLKHKAVTKDLQVIILDIFIENWRGYHQVKIAMIIAENLKNDM